MTTVREARVAAAQAVLKGHLDDSIMITPGCRYKQNGTSAIAEILAQDVVDVLFPDHNLRQRAGRLMTAMFIRRTWVALEPNEYGLFRQRRVWKHRAEDYGAPLTVDKIKEQLDART